MFVLDRLSRRDASHSHIRIQKIRLADGFTYVVRDRA